MAMTNPRWGFRLAVFDVAGTTVLDGDAVISALLDVVGPVVPLTIADVAAVMGLPKPVAIKALLVAHGVPDDDDLPRLVGTLFAEFKGRLLERYREPGVLTPVPGALEVFSALREGGVRVVLDTGFSRDVLDTVMDALGWHDGATVDLTVASDEVLRGRPHPDMIARAMALCGVLDPADVVKVGDTPADITEGLAAGCGLVVGVTYGTHDERQLAAPGVEIIDRLPDLLSLMRVLA